MNLAILAYGTRGDVQPLLSLAVALRERGHTVRFAAPENFSAVTERAGVVSCPIAMDAEALMRSEVATEVLAKGDLYSFAKMLLQAERLGTEVVNAAVRQATDGVELVVAGTLMGERAWTVCEAAGIPLVMAHIYPALPTADYAYPLLPVRTLGWGWLNRWSGYAIIDAVFRAARPIYAAFRASYGLPPRKRSALRTSMEQGVPHLLAYSPSVAPPPSDWGPNATVTGWLDVPPALRQAFGEQRTDPALAAWLDAGSAPVFFGFGSMPIRDPEKLMSWVRAACRAHGVRALVGAGWSRYAAPDQPEIHVAPAFDHAAVLPRCRAAVIHGGSHTTYAALRAGLPTHICAVLGDQPLWGRRLVALGVGSWGHFKTLDEATLVAAVGGLLRPEPAAAAAALSERLRAEDGLAAAVRVVEAAARR